MIRYAVGYYSRAIVSFGEPIRLSEYDPNARRSMVQLNRRLRDDIGRLYTVVPSALMAAAMRPSIQRDELEDQIDRLIEILKAGGARLAVETGREAVEAATEPFTIRKILVVEGDRYRVRERTVLRYYARTIEHLLKDRRRPALTH